MMRILMTGLLVAAICGPAARAKASEAQVSEAQAKDEAAIRATGEAYVKAFNQHDAKSLAAFWSPEAVYTNRVTGEQVVGQAAIAEQFATLFASAKGLKLEVRVKTIQFVSPNVAVEHGLARILGAESGVEEADYSAVYVRRDGKWLLDRVADDPKPAARSHYEQLKPLEWMIGDWQDEDEAARIVTQCNWTKNKNYITRSFTVSIADRVELSGMQIIGWDAAAKQIRSWTFDSDGGFAEGTWARKGDRWYVHKKGTTAEGKSATAVNVITCVDNNTFTLQSVQRTLGGEMLPNVDEVLVARK